MDTTASSASTLARSRLVSASSLAWLSWMVCAMRLNSVPTSPSSSFDTTTTRADCSPAAMRPTACISRPSGVSRARSSSQPMPMASATATAPPPPSNQACACCISRASAERWASKRFSSADRSASSLRTSAITLAPFSTSAAVATCCDTPTCLFSARRLSSSGWITFCTQSSAMGPICFRRACCCGLSCVRTRARATWRRMASSSRGMICTRLSFPVSMKPRVEFWICSTALAIWSASSSTSSEWRSHALAAAKRLNWL
ncbi:hypothetical protein ASD15_29965 [Massilia sp. Root351]|nr:hypothetical protein ASD15_29965 [Massilia sp. Root351]